MADVGSSRPIARTQNGPGLSWPSVDPGLRLHRNEQQAPGDDARRAKLEGDRAVPSYPLLILGSRRENQLRRQQTSLGKRIRADGYRGMGRDLRHRVAAKFAETAFSSPQLAATPPRTAFVD